MPPGDSLTLKCMEDYICSFFFKLLYSLRENKDYLFQSFPCLFKAISTINRKSLLKEYFFTFLLTLYTYSAWKTTYVVVLCTLRPVLHRLRFDCDTCVGRCIRLLASFIYEATSCEIITFAHCAMNGSVPRYLCCSSGRGK